MKIIPRTIRLNPVLFTVLAAAGLLLGGTALGADPGANAGASGPVMTWQEAVQYGGWLMWVLAAMSVFALALIVYFLFTLRVGQTAPRRLRRELIENLTQGDRAEARKLCEDIPCPLSTVTLAAMDYLRDIPDPDPVLLKDIIESEGARQAERMQGATQLLLDVGAIAPMVGLLGTVFGMLQAFGGIAYSMESAKPVVLAQGVSQALVTTAFGLLIGIPAMMFYAYFRRRASRQIAILEVAVTDILTALLRSPGS